MASAPFTANVENQLRTLERDGKTAMLIAVDHRLAGIIAVADAIKDNAAQAVADLGRDGVQVVMLAGDNEQTAEAIARQVGIERVIANVLPEEKAREIQRLRDAGEIVAMVGDGINGAPALATALPRAPGGGHRSRGETEIAAAHGYGLILGPPGGQGREHDTGQIQERRPTSWR